MQHRDVARTTGRRSGRIGIRTIIVIVVVIALVAVAFGGVLDFLKPGPDPVYTSPWFMYGSV
jgi:hypothetical protein